MQIIQTENTFQPNEDKLNIETPTKKVKKSYIIEPNTADSIALTDQKSSTLKEIQPQQLFERFHQIMKISQITENQQPEIYEESVYRSLNYESNEKKVKKLAFSPDTSSMNKKNKVQNGKCLSGQVKGKQLFDIIPIKSQKKMKSNQFLLSNNSMDQFVIASTPTKKQKYNIHCQMTAKKQSPYRDLIRKQ